MMKAKIANERDLNWENVSAMPETWSQSLCRTWICDADIGTSVIAAGAVFIMKETHGFEVNRGKEYS
jgi:hypothetical protein